MPLRSRLRDELALVPASEHLALITPDLLRRFDFFRVNR
jgi:hypothetical protein